jgi:hypothetical protein
LEAVEEHLGRHVGSHSRTPLLLSVEAMSTNYCPTAEKWN